MRAENVVVTRLSTKDVKTRFGNKQTHSFQADGNWYSTGFKKSSAAVGESISFNYEVDDYGNQVDPTSIIKGAAPLAPTNVAGSTPSRSVTTYSGGKGVFPIPALDGQRSIVRQNALTNAREVLVASAGGKAFPVDITTTAAQTIALARLFEAYTAGDLDMEEVLLEEKAAAVQEKKAA